MPSKSSKQNSGHSLEDMLEQLETVERDYESEPQVLDDGRIKVKKRKRRTKQAVHAKRKKRRIRSIALASLLLLGLLSAFLASKRMTHFYQSNEFLTSLEEQLSQNLQGDVKLKGLSSQNGEIYLNSLTVNSLNASNVKRAYFENLSSKINPWAWTKKRWDLKRLHAEKGRIELDATNPVATAGASIGSGFMENNSPAEPDLAVALTLRTPCSMVQQAEKAGMYTYETAPSKAKTSSPLPSSTPMVMPTRRSYKSARRSLITKMLSRQ